MKGRRIHGESNVWSTAQRQKKSTDLIFMLGLNETIDQHAMVNSVDWYGHVLRRGNSHVLRKALDFQADGERKKSILQRTWKKLQIGAGLYAVGRPVQKRNDEDGKIGTIQSLPLERGALFNRFFGEPAHGPPHVACGASGPIGGCRDESRTDNPDLDL